MLLISALIVALASPQPQPQPTNPFTLDPATSPPAAVSIPIIGTTRTRPLCTTLRKAVAPALQAAMKNDATSAELRTAAYDFMLNGTEYSSTMRVIRMDRQVQTLLDSVNALDGILNSQAWYPPLGTSSDESKRIEGIRNALKGTLESQKVQLQAMSGFVDTERQIVFGTASESERMMRKATSGDQQSLGPNGTMQPADINKLPDVPNEAFKRDTANVLMTPVGHIAVSDAQKVDADLGMLAQRTSIRERAATELIVPAAKSCQR